MSWGVVPPWINSREEFRKTYYSTFNARAESVIEGNRLWKALRKNHRCCVPIQGYFEWQHTADEKTGKKVKIPYYVSRKDGKLIYLAGLWSKAFFKEKGEEGEGEQVFSFTVITGPATKELKWLHTRTPLFLEPGTDKWDKWLSDEDWSDEMGQCLKGQEDVLQWYEVSKDVGKTTNEGEHLIEPVKKEGAVGGYFKRFTESDNGDKKEDIKIEDLKKEDILKEDVKKEPDVKKEDVKKEDVKTEDIKKEDVKKEPHVKTEEVDIKSPPKSPSKSQQKKTRRKRSPDKNQPSIAEHFSKKPKTEVNSTISSRVRNENE